MRRREFFASTLAARAFAQRAAPPNIVLVLADDLGYGDVKCFNPDSRIETPRMDALARQGVMFTDAHSPSAVCTPTRYGIMTGRYCWRSRLKSGVLNGYSPALINPGRATLASMAKKQGFRTGCFGKWHLGLGDDAKTDFAKELKPSPLDFGFDEFFGIPASLDMPPYLYVKNRRAVEQPIKTIAENGAPPRGPFWRGGPIAPDFRMEEVLPRITQSASEFIRESASQRKPFFAYVPLASPHTPWVPVNQWEGKSKAGLYGDFVAQTDASIGQLVDAVRVAGIEENTLFVVTSDNGAPWSEPDIVTSGGQLANSGWRGQKADAYEGGHRVPFIARWPGHVKAGSRSDSLWVHTDFFATFASLLGAPLGADMAEDSFDQSGALAGGSGARQDGVMHSADGLFVMRRGEWKFIEGFGSGGFTPPRRLEAPPNGPPGQLFNLRVDPQETRDLAAACPEVVKELQARLNDCRSATQTRS